MNNFDLKNPTKIIFGKDTIAKVKEEIPQDAKVLLLYGGGSIKKNGIYDQVKTALANVEVVEFGGIPANPEYSVLMEALKVIKDQNITYLLAVGDGSEIGCNVVSNPGTILEPKTMINPNSTLKGWVKN